MRIGLLSGGGGTRRLPRLVGIRVATEMIVKGMRYTEGITAATENRRPMFTGA